MMRNRISLQSLTYKTCAYAIFVCISLSALWAILPLFGWSYYSPEGIKISCSVEWQDRSWNIMSYNITIFVFAFFLPLLILLIANLKIIKIVI